MTPKPARRTAGQAILPITSIPNGEGLTAVQYPLVNTWRTWQFAQSLSKRTVDERVATVTRMANWCQTSPESATSEQIAEWLAAGDWMPRTRWTYHRALSAWFTWLQLQGHRLDNPMIKVGVPRGPDRQPRPISDADLVRLLQTRMWASTRRMILLAALAGLRVHEIAKVRGEDVDLGARLLWVTGKGRRLRSVPLHPILVEVASEMPVAGWWFPMRGRESEHILSKSVSDIIGRTMRRAGVWGTPHSLRHWYASAMVANGVDIRVVQECLRHRSLATTQVYARVSDDQRRAAVAGLDPWRALRSESRHLRAV